MTRGGGTLLLLLLAWLLPGLALAVDRTLAGSAQGDYHLAPTAIRRGGNAFDGITLELALKLSVDLSDRFSANVKVCFGCHGFETVMGHFDYRLADELRFRVGRFSPSFGAFNLRHDPANHRLSDKPLPYDMGRMLRMRDWNLGVLPSPFPDNGVEVSGTHWFGNKVQADYAGYAVSGFKGDRTSFDLDWVQSRSGSLYYADNNSLPSFGGRASLTLKLSDRDDLTIGASSMAGTFDPERRLWYAFGGLDASLRWARTTLRIEYLVRRQEFDVAALELRYAVPPEGGAFWVKHGAYIELEQPLTRQLDLVVRGDGLLRYGNVPVSSPLDKTSWVVRETLGVAYLVERHLRIKASSELWQFSYDGASGRDIEASFHLGAVATF